MTEESVNSTNTDSVNGESKGKLFRSQKQEKAPLLSQSRLFRSLSGIDLSSSSGEQSNSLPRTLGTFGGVFAPVALSQFSSLLFLRVGFLIGNVGLLSSIATLVLAYGILLFTILSICAISTNGAVEGGGAYYMISRTLGPEFGGAIGVLFFLANIFSSALYSTGCVEGLIQNFGESSGNLLHFLPEGGWYSFLYASIVNFFNLVICLIGAALFAKTTVVILVVVLTCTTSVIVSFLALNHLIEVEIPLANEVYHNVTGNYTGLSLHTLEDNLYPEYTTDYTTGNMVDFATIFGVLFSGVTGIMAGANMSGELKEPGKSIPTGTLLATMFTMFLYFILFLLTAATSSRFLLQNNYLFMFNVNVWPPFITVGIITATISASLSNIIGASRVLAALVKDEIYGKLTNWIGQLQFNSNPIGAVLFSAFLVELVFLIGGLNTIARFTSVFFLLSYLATNVACLGLEWASAPNFRPTFKFFSWWTAVLGIASSVALMFIISPTAAGICIIVCLLLVILLHLKSPGDLHLQWGSISQALIFHQVRKYLLLLDSRKDHVKFWRPQMLLLVSDPRKCCPLINFVNDLKKSGLFIIGHIKIGEFDGKSVDPVAVDYPRWLSLIDQLKVKAFVEVTLAKSVCDGLHQLVRISGLGAMKPNTILLGFPENEYSQDFYHCETSAYAGIRETEHPNIVWFSDVSAPYQHISPLEYVSMVRDVITMGKNVCLCRQFHLFDRAALIKNAAKNIKFIDVWPINFFHPDNSNVFDTTSLFTMQLATILNMVSVWHKRTKIRVFLCFSSRDQEFENQQKQVKHMLYVLRIQADIIALPWDSVISILSEVIQSSDEEVFVKIENDLCDTYLNEANQMISRYSHDTAVTFLYLPKPPDEESLYAKYLLSLSMLTKDLPPVVMVHGTSAVTTTNL